MKNKNTNEMKDHHNKMLKTALLIGNGSYLASYYTRLHGNNADITALNDIISDGGQNEKM